MIDDDSREDLDLPAWALFVLFGSLVAVCAPVLRVIGGM